jgi:hypothetical protein
MFSQPHVAPFLVGVAFTPAIAWLRKAIERASSVLRCANRSHARIREGEGHVAVEPQTS